MRPQKIKETHEVYMEIQNSDADHLRLTPSSIFHITNKLILRQLFAHTLNLISALLQCFKVNFESGTDL